MKNIRKSNAIYVLLIFVLIFVFFVMLLKTSDSSFIKNLKDQIKIDTNAIYITDGKNYKEDPINVLKKYDIPYKYINSDKLNSIEKSKLQKIINNKYLTNIIVIFESGKVKDAIIEYKSEDQLLKFFKKNEIIPDVLGDISLIFDKVNNAIGRDYMLLYVPYKYEDYIEDEDYKLKSLCDEYDIDYEKVDAYLLSYIQQEKLNTIFQISQVKDQVIILIKNQEIIGSIRGIHSKENIVNSLYEFDFFDPDKEKLLNINYSDYEELLNKDSKSLIMIGEEDCKDCDLLIIKLKPISNKNNLVINYLDYNNLSVKEKEQINKLIKNYNFNIDISRPITLVVGSNGILDCIVGNTDKHYYEELFSNNELLK